MNSSYETIIGIETHVQLATRSKLFCGCDNDSRDAEPNTHVCEVCMGFPGTLPVLNKRAVELALRLGVALNADYKLPMHTKFDRKNYFYPDSPKGYQITQFDEPIVPNGYVEFPFEEGTKRVGITRAHLEGDAGKLTHPDGVDYSLVDLNRAETPLLEIVSEPHMRSAAEAKAYAQELHHIVRYAGVSDANLYYGNMRFDVNVSVRSQGHTRFGTRTETKNLNSFRAIERVVEYESARQVGVIEDGGKIRQETRGWDEAKQATYPMRSKEDADEYRYFPEPDLPPLVITQTMLVKSSRDLERPQDVRHLLADRGIAKREAEVLVRDLDARELWQKVLIRDPASAQFALNWLIGDAVKLADSTEKNVGDSGINESNLSFVAAQVAAKKLSSTNAKQLLAYLWENGLGRRGHKIENRQETEEEIEEMVVSRGLAQNSDTDELTKVVEEVIESNRQAVADYAAGNQKAFGALVGAAMKASKGQGNPQVLSTLIRAKLEG